MKNTQNTVTAPVSPEAAGAAVTAALETAIVPATPAPEIIRPLSVVDSLFTEDGDRMTLKKGSEVNASEFAMLIIDRETRGTKLKSQARWIWHAAGQLENGEYVQSVIAGKLREAMTPSAFAQLRSEAKTLIPLILSEGIKAPLSTLKDAIGELALKDDGKLKDARFQTKAAQELIPLLKSGKVTQAKVREIRKSHTTQAPKPPASQAPIAESVQNAQAVVEAAKVVGGLKFAIDYLDKNKVVGDEAKALVNLATQLARLLGMVVSVAPATK